MRFGYVALVAVFVALGIGATGLPGDALAAVVRWLSDGGHIELEGPVGEGISRVI